MLQERAIMAMKTHGRRAYHRLAALIITSPLL